MNREKKTKNTFERVYEVTEQIPEGRVTTYGMIASILGNPRLARVVGYALHVCPAERAVPCHRIVNRNGELSKAFDCMGVSQQRLLLEEEQIGFTLEGRVDLEAHLWYGPEEG